VQRGEVWSCGTRDNTGALLNIEVGFRAMERVVAPDPTSTGRRGPELRDTWRLVVACSTACLAFMPVRGVPDLQGTDSYSQWRISFHCF
jgi:hypothetical protein